MGRTLEETETSIYQNAAARDYWRVGTADPVMIRKMARLGIEPDYIKPGGWHEYTLRANQISFRRGVTREVSEAKREQGKRLAERSKQLREARSDNES